jgi:D-galactarolactone cycloisomerase
MKITAVETTVVSLPCETGGPPPLFAGKPWTHLDILVVRVKTDEGLVGWGEAFGHAAIPSTKAALDSIVAPLVLGRDPREVHSMTRELLHAIHLLGRNGPFVYAFSGVEIALWDIIGKLAGLPVYRLLGGGRRTELPAYASLLNYGGSPELVAKNTAAACAEGYRHVKLHETNRQAVLAAIGAPGADNTRIMLDVNCA